MILSDRDIKKALKNGTLIINPKPEDRQIDATTIDLRIGNKLYIWNPDLVKQKGVSVNVTLGDFDYPALARKFQTLVSPHKGKFYLERNQFYISSTLETIHLPTKSKLAARVEGKSTLARLGLVVHMTAPTIHCGYGPGIITLEMFNYGPFPIIITPEESLICQLIIERVSTTPKERENRTFTKPKTPQG